MYAHLSVTARIDRAEAALEVENLHALHVYYHGMGHHREELEDLWLQDGISWTHNYGTWFREKFFQNYVEGQEAESRETYAQLLEKYPEVKEHEWGWRAMNGQPIHAICSPIIEVAEDAQSAKGLWYTPAGAFTNIDPSGKKFGMWMWERYGGDFVKTEAGWRYQNLRIGCDISGIADQMDPFAERKGPPDAEQHEAGGPEAEDMNENPHGGESDLPGTHKEYSPTTLPQNDPFVPYPYKTYSEVEKYLEVGK